MTLHTLIPRAKQEKPRVVLTMDRREDMMRTGTPCIPHMVGMWLMSIFGSASWARSTQPTDAHSRARVTAFTPSNRHCLQQDVASNKICNISGEYTRWQWFSCHQCQHLNIANAKKLKGLHNEHPSIICLVIRTFLLVVLFVGLETHQLLRLFVPIYFWSKIKSNYLTKTHTQMCTKQNNYLI
jgi:hypothetical protein